MPRRSCIKVAICALEPERAAEHAEEIKLRACAMCKERIYRCNCSACCVAHCEHFFSNTREPEVCKVKADDMRSRARAEENEEIKLGACDM